MNNITELVFILDRSGSMHGLEADTIGGFNSMIDKQRRQEGTVLVSTVLFSDSSSVLHDRVPLDKIRPLTDEDYFTGGCTALLDAVGGAIRHISTVHRYARPEDVPAHTMFIITTDGMENASRAYNQSQVKELIESRKKDGWEFLFLGANIDAVATAGSFGIPAERAVRYCADRVGTQVNFCAMSKAISSVRCGSSVDDDWAEEARAYYESTCADS
ncbi:MAG: VWA domain-containing protein [Ruminococcaceae bacterium]|nr:VWA domain-containing protein [Oscillospiraceae bacterium]